MPNTLADVYSQAPFSVRTDWGVRGTLEAALRDDILIIVDVLSFSTTVVAAVHHGAKIYPHPMREGLQEYGLRVGATVLHGRSESLRAGLPSLSPLSFDESCRGKVFVLASLNGAACSHIGKLLPGVLVGALTNASAVGNTANELQRATGKSITVIACGEQWIKKDDQGKNFLSTDQTLRPSIEDYLGVGAILSYLDGTRSPEATVCQNAFQQSANNLEKLIWDCSSGRELRARGFSRDVTFATVLNAFNDVPRLNQTNLDSAFFEGAA